MTGPAEGIDDVVYRLAMATAAETGDAYISALVTCLHDVMPVSVAFVAQGQGRPVSRATAVMSWMDGKLGVPIEYALEGTPCRMTYAGDTVIVPKSLPLKFPREPERFQSYCGVPLLSRDGDVLGHFAVFSQEVISEPQKVESIVRLFGMRAAAELQRLADDAEREAMIRKLDQQRAALHRANTFKSGALGMVAHDLRNPLAAIMSRAELMQTVLGKISGDDIGEAGLGRLRKSTESVLKAADRMDGMITTLLDAARAEHDHVQIETLPAALSVPVLAAIGICEREAAAKDITVAYDVTDAPVVPIDENRMTEALVNLLSNAIKYSSPGDCVVLDTRRVADGKTVRLEVRDTGPGLSSDDMERSFQPYQTLTAKPTAGETSTGLGLVVVKAVAEAHGGEAGVQSAGLGQGATFWIDLPV